MQPRFTHRIDRHLDEKLGVWTRLLPWRQEIAGHIEEAYEAAQVEAAESPVADAAWQKALADFGDVEEVAFELRKEHWPQYFGWRILAVVISALAVSSKPGWLCFLDVPAACFTLGPMIAFVVCDAWRGSTRWDLANRAGVWGGLSGAMVGAAAMFSNMNDPRNLGASLALSVLSSLYCVLFFTPRRLIVVALIGIVFVEMGLLLVTFGNSSAMVDSAAKFELFQPQDWSVNTAFVMRIVVVCGAGVCAGIARFGIYGVARHTPAIGAGTFLVSLIVLLTDVSDPRFLVPHSVVAVGAMALAIAGSHCVSDSSRLVRRVLS